MKSRHYNFRRFSCFQMNKLRRHFNAAPAYYSGETEANVTTNQMGANTTTNETETNVTTNETETITAGMKTLHGILGGLKLRDNNDNISRVSNKYQTSNTPYDIIIRINSLDDLSSKGWEIVLGERAQKFIFESHAAQAKKSEQTADSTSKNPTSEVDNLIQGDANSCKPESDMMTGIIVTILGAYNRGKSFLLNELCHIKVPSGDLIRTEGISITAGRERYTKIVFVDTAGTDTPVKSNAIECKRATDALIRELVLHLCSFIIIVVNRLRATDQIYIKQILKYCKSTNKKTGIIIVHNLLDLSRVNDVTTIIEEEVKTIFDATEDEMQISVNGSHRTIRFFKSVQEDIDLRHFILAKAESEAAKKWNIQSLDGIMNIFQTSSEYKRDLDIINSMVSFINEKLPQLLVRSNSENSNSQQTLQVVQHNDLPYIVLFDRKDHEDPKQDPSSKFGLAKPIIYDDSGYFIRHESNLWQPRHNLYGNEHSIYAIFELPGVESKDIENLKIRENSILIEGIRSDLKMSPTDAVLHQSEIRSGSFKLEILLPCAVELDSAEAKSDAGLVIITVSKKKSIEKNLKI